jgi:hypothetical protein
MTSSSLIISTFLVAWHSGAGLRPDSSSVRLNPHTLRNVSSYKQLQSLANAAANLFTFSLTGRRVPVQLLVVSQVSLKDCSSTPRASSISGDNRGS